MGKGRKKTPDEIRALTGARDMTGSKGASPEFQKGCEPPSWMTGYALEEWAVVAPQLERLGMLDAVGAACLAGYCEAVATLRLSSEDVEKFGPTMITATGGLKKNPAVTAQLEAIRVVRGFAGEFGFTPASKAKLVAPGGEEDPLDQFLDPPIKLHGNAG